MIVNKGKGGGGRSGNNDDEITKAIQSSKSFGQSNDG